MKRRKLIALIMLGTGLLISCNKEKHWETTVNGVSNITAYSAQISIDYNFGGKSANAWIGVDFGIAPDLKTKFERAMQEAKDTEFVTFEKSQLYANQTYYVRSFMVCKKDKDTVWSEIVSFTTLSEPSLPCTVTAGEVYYSANGMTETVGDLVEIENTSNPDLFTYEVAAAVGNLTFSFRYDPSSGNYVTADESFVINEDGFVQISCWFNDGTSNCHYEAETGQNIYVTRDANSNISISFCELAILKSDAGTCVNSQEISGKLKN